MITDINKEPEISLICGVDETYILVGPDWTRLPPTSSCHRNVPGDLNLDADCSCSLTVVRSSSPARQFRTLQCVPCMHALNDNSLCSI